MNTKLLSWIVVICTILVIFLPVQFANPLIANITMFVVGSVSLTALFLILIKQEKTTSNTIKVVSIMTLTVIAMMLMYLMPTTF